MEMKMFDTGYEELFRIGQKYVTFAEAAAYFKRNIHVTFEDLGEDVVSNEEQLRNVEQRIVETLPAPDDPCFYNVFK